MKRNEVTVKNYHQAEIAMSLYDIKKTIIFRNHEKNNKHPPAVDRYKKPSKNNQSSKRSGGNFRAMTHEDSDDEPAFFDPIDGQWYSDSIGDLYNHDDEEDEGENGDQNSDHDGGNFGAMSSGDKPKLKNMACYKFANKGVCPNGDKCRFSHDYNICKKAFDKLRSDLKKQEARFYPSQDARNNFRSTTNQPQEPTSDAKESS